MNLYIICSFALKYLKMEFAKYKRTVKLKKDEEKSKKNVIYC